MTRSQLPDSDRIAAAVLACPGVIALHGGVFGEVATYLPGRRVIGVQVGADRVAVHFTALLGEPVLRVAADVRAAATPLACGWPLDVVVEDVGQPGDLER